MSSFEKWAERIYAETDFGKGIATSLSGAVGLTVYLLFGDWAIAAFSLIIFFPLARITATAIHTRLSRTASRRSKRSNAEHVYGNLSEEEKEVVAEFVRYGGCVLTWGQTNKSAVSSAAIESLLQREVLSTSITADGMRETFVLDPTLFEVGLSHWKAATAS